MENATIKTPKKTLWLRALCIVIALAILAAIPAVLTPVLMPKYLSVSKEGSLTEEYYSAVAETSHDVLFVGDDWFNTPSWKEMEAKFATVGVRVVYFPRTKGTSSTLLSATLKKLREGGEGA